MTTNAVVVVQTPFSRVRDSTGARRMQVEASFPADGPSTDAFGRLRVSNPVTVFDSKQVFDDQPLLFSNDLAGPATQANYIQQRSATELLSGITNGNRATRQTKRYFNYQPGKGQAIFATFNMYGAEPGAEKRIGYFDDDNGVFIRLQGDGTIDWVRRSNATGSVVSTVATQTAWNLDTLDGSDDVNNPSGLTLDLTKVQIAVIDFEWLGVGTMRVGFDIDGEIIYTHEFLHANIGTTVYMQTPNLPVRWEVENTGTPSSSGQLDCICCTVISEGGINPISSKRSVDRGIAATTVGTALEPVISLRLKAASNRATVFPDVFNLLAVNAGDYRWALLLFPGGAGLPAGTWTSVTNSAVEYDVARTAVTIPSNGVILRSGYGSNTNQISASHSEADIASVLAVGADYAGVSDEIVLAVQTTAGSNDFLGSLGWIEVL